VVAVAVARLDEEMCGAMGGNLGGSCKVEVARAKRGWGRSGPWETTRERMGRRDTDIRIR
jgi:hypothetical protein